MPINNPFGYFQDEEEKSSGFGKYMLPRRANATDVPYVQGPPDIIPIEEQVPANTNMLGLLANPSVARALMAAGGTMMSTPGSTSQAFGAGLQSGLGAYDQSENQRFRQEITRQQLEQQDKRIGYEGDRVEQGNKRIAQQDKEMGLRERALELDEQGQKALESYRTADLANRLETTRMAIEGRAATTEMRASANQFSDILKSQENRQELAAETQQKADEVFSLNKPLREQYTLKAQEYSKELGRTVTPAQAYSLEALGPIHPWRAAQTQSQEQAPVSNGASGAPRSAIDPLIYQRVSEGLDNALSKGYNTTPDLVQKTKQTIMSKYGITEEELQNHPKWKAFVGGN